MDLIQTTDFCMAGAWKAPAQSAILKQKRRFRMIAEAPGNFVAIAGGD